MECRAIVHRPRCKRALDYSPSPPDNEPTKRDAPGISDDTYEQRYQERLEEYRTSKAEELERPFDPNTASTPSECAEEPREPVRMLVGHSNKPQMHRIPRCQVTEKHTSLSNDIIAGILLRCTPSSPKARAWVSAHRASKAAEERAKVSSKERDGLRRQVLQLRPKSEWTKVIKTKTKEVVESGYDAKEDKVNSEQVVPEADEMKEESFETQTGIPPTEEELRIARMQHLEASYISGGQTKQVIRVLKTTARLQIVTCDDEEPAGISNRVMGELRRYYRGPGE